MDRKILIGMIVDTNYLRQIRNVFELKYLEAPEAQKVADWCLEYFDTYGKAPGRDIENIFIEKSRSQKVSEDEKELLEEHILPSLNDEYVSEGINSDYLLDTTYDYFYERFLLLRNEEVEYLIEKGDIKEAMRVAQEPIPLSKSESTDTDLASEDAMIKLERAFNEDYQSVITYPGALGHFINPQLVRGAFVAFQAPEKTGKTYWLLDMAIRAARQHKNVAFIQAGDMTEAAQMKRIAMYLARKSTLERYTGTIYKPVRDCIHNQLDTCSRPERESDFGLFEDGEYTEQTLRKEVNYDNLKELSDTISGYGPCHNCKEYAHQKWGTPWFEKIEVPYVLDFVEAKKKYEEFFVDKERHFILSTHPADSLSVADIHSLMDTWYKDKGFVPDLLIVDYADIMKSEGEFRHSQNKIWMGLRGISTQRHCLVVTVTQADSNSYKTDTQTKGNFSEDKRKYAHTTATYGMNQDVSGREKKIGILRLNELMLREGDFDVGGQVHILQRLQIGRPYLTSYL